MAFEIKRARGKTAVFSGTKQHNEFVPKLEDLCIQKLLSNLNRIECVGDVPYYILKPLLTKISFSQLRRIESYNPVSSVPFITLLHHIQHACTNIQLPFILRSILLMTINRTNPGRPIVGVISREDYQNKMKLGAIYSPGVNAKGIIR